MRPLPLILGLIALVSGGAFLYVAFSVAVEGTGAAIPTGAGVVEGTVAEGPTVQVPTGRPARYGDVKVTDPQASRAVDHHWSSPVGEAEVTLDTTEGPVTVELPPARDWKGVVREETVEVGSLFGIPVLEDHPEIGDRQPPPYLIVVRALRTGDPVVARVEGERAVELHVGDRATLERNLAQREAMRWPMVGLMAIMGLIGLGLAVFGFRKARSPRVVEGETADGETADGESDEAREPAG